MMGITEEIARIAEFQPHSPPTESESTIQQDFKGIFTYIKVWEVLF